MSKSTNSFFSNSDTCFTSSSSSSGFCLFSFFVSIFFTVFSGNGTASGVLLSTLSFWLTEQDSWFAISFSKIVVKSCTSFSFLSSLTISPKLLTICWRPFLVLVIIGLGSFNLTFFTSLLDNLSNLISYREESKDFYPTIFGKGAEENFANFFEKLEENNFPHKMVKNYYYFQLVIYLSLKAFEF